MAVRMHMLWILLSSLVLAAPLSHVLLPDCCAVPGGLPAAAAAPELQTDDCCGAGGSHDKSRGSRQSPDERRDGGCDCPLRCCSSALPLSAQAIDEPASAAPPVSERLVGPPPAAIEAREPSLDLMRPPRS